MLLTDGAHASAIAKGWGVFAAIICLEPIGGA